MHTEFSPSAAYGQFHTALLEQRSRVESAEVIHSINRALLAGERVNAAFYDLSLLKQLQQRKILPRLNAKVDAEIKAFINELDPLLSEKLSDEAQFDKLQRKVAKLSRHFDWQHANMALVQNALFIRTYQRWQETLEALFSNNDSSVFYTRLKQVLKKSSGRVALLGETHELYLVLADLLAICREKAAENENVDDHDSLSGYIAAADIATRGIITFGATAEAILRDRPLPTATQISERIKQLHSSVTERTHPWFATQ